jgi:acetyl esterase/lipase
VDSNNPTQLQAKMTPGPQTPPTFLAVALDDKACSDSSLAYFQGMRAANIHGELHVYAGGGHGFGIRPRAGVSATWTDRCADWMRTMKILPSASK